MFQTNIVLDVLYIFQLIKKSLRSMVFLKIHSYLLVKMDVFKSFVQHLCNISFNKKSKKRSCSKYTPTPKENCSKKTVQRKLFKENCSKKIVQRKLFKENCSTSYMGLPFQRWHNLFLQLFAKLPLK